MNIVVIQARMGSSRLPGKVLQELAGRSVLEHVVRRAERIDGIDAVWCAIPDLEIDDELATAADRIGARVFRGSESNVLQRYYGAAAEAGADVVMRITADCPLLDWEVSGSVLREFLTRNLDYASNLEPRSWPKGLDTEVFSRAALGRTQKEAVSDYDREHVTPFMRAQPGFKRGGVVCADGDYSAWRWTLDYPQDLLFCRQVMERARSELPSFAEIREILEREPEIAGVNAHLT